MIDQVEEQAKGDHVPQCVLLEVCHVFSVLKNLLGHLHHWALMEVFNNFVSSVNLLCHRCVWVQLVVTIRVQAISIAIITFIGSCDIPSLLDVRNCLAFLRLSPLLTRQ